VVNNIDDEALLLENTISTGKSNNYLKVKLIGTTKNHNGIGSIIYVWAANNKQFHYQSPVRGYLSTVEDVAHFGFGNINKIDSLKIIWPDGKVEVKKNISTNQTISTFYSEAKSERKKSNKIKEGVFFKSDAHLKAIKHQENLHSDYDAQPLLLHQHSQMGPCIAKGNVDGLIGEEIFIGGANGSPSRLYFQNNKEEFIGINLPDSLSEDTDAAFFDFDLDGDQDLYVVSGGTEFLEDSKEYNDRLYLNDGNGNYQLRKDLLPATNASGSCVAPCDFDKDGDIDLFVGGRVSPRNYPFAPESYLLKNENGKFIIVTPVELKNIGMVTDAIWSDHDHDGWQDLIVVGEWMPITIFKNNGSKLTQSAHLKNLSSYGLWNCIAAGDLDNDGDEDFLIGNIGKNTRMQATAQKPIYLYKNDFDKNGSPDPLIGYYCPNKSGEENIYPLHARDDAVRQLTSLKTRYVKYADFGQATITEIFKTELGDEDFLFANELKSIALINRGNGTFKKMDLPKEVQLAPVRDIFLHDFDRDGNLDALISGNDCSAEKNGGWHDASNGLYLAGNGDGTFSAVPTSKSGFYVPGDGREIIKWSNKKGEEIILVGQNNDAILNFTWKTKNQ
ncbi:MAG: FG-GAP-like repeat-containing protein, partial [Bacteroidota bacterium]